MESIQKKFIQLYNRAKEQVEKWKVLKDELGDELSRAATIIARLPVRMY